MNKQKVRVAELRPGMFVCELDRPWLETPFPLQGLLIENREQIEALERYCTYVYIDPLKGSSGESDPAPKQAAASRAVPGGKAASASRPVPGSVLYEEQATVEEELPRAEPIRQSLYALMREVEQQIRNGRMLEPRTLKEALGDMVDSVIRNPHALLLLTRLKAKDVTLLGHSIDAAICLLAFGRHLGLHRDELQLLGLGGLLYDIGKIRLPEEVLTKKGRLSAQELKLMKGHVRHGVEILEATPGMPPEVIEMAATHHEREDGSGYPDGLDGDQVGPFGKMAAIVDCFQELTSDRPPVPPVPHAVALQMMHQWRHQLFNGYLVEEFIQCLGAYPVGSVVELSTGEVAVVATPNPSNRLKPRVILVLDGDKKPYPTRKLVDLEAEGPDSREIKRALEPGAFGVNPQDCFRR
ncbi:HD-GYP domain-containing protein [Pelomicrobium sp.]|uniref:HD-GYP domain-containing protein n=1 Tax=Pelomicrobium sp. TaxID=2815319 RepID=UPI002FDC826A